MSVTEWVIPEARTGCQRLDIGGFTRQQQPGEEEARRQLDIFVWLS